jgi:hypothetical protein
MLVGSAPHRLIGSGTSAAKSASVVYIGTISNPQNPLPPTHVAEDHERIACTQIEPSDLASQSKNAKIRDAPQKSLASHLPRCCHGILSSKSIGTCACKHAIWASDIDTSPDPEQDEPGTVLHGSLRSCSWRAFRCPLANIVLANACGLL